MYAPRGHDPQTPHTRDEINCVVKGTGLFFNGTGRKPFRPGDLLFAAPARAFLIGLKASQTTLLSG